jgi:hypothetical protein
MLLRVIVLNGLQCITGVRKALRGFRRVKENRIFGL